MDAKQFLKERMQVWCINRKEWEKKPSIPSAWWRFR